MTIPELNALAKKYQDQGVVVLGVSLDEKGWPAIKNFTKRQAIDYTIVLSTPEVQKAYDDLLDALPTALIIDKDGKIRHRFEGVTNKDAFEKQLQPLL